MRTISRIFVFAALLALPVSLRAQTYVLAPQAFQQFFSNNGQPLAGGLIYTCGAGLACPGSPLATYTDSTGSTQNQNPVQLDSAGRASIWINSTLAYKFVLVNSLGVTIKTTDNITATGGGGGGGGTNFWTLTGSTIQNNNGGGLPGAGTVQVGSDLQIGGNAVITGGVKLLSAASGGNYATITATNAMPGNVTWRWPKVDATGCFSSDGAGNLSIAACGSGSGTPGLPSLSVQFNNAGAFAGDNNFLYGPTATPPQVSLAGVFQANTTSGGFNAPVATSFNSFQAPSGGMHALSFTAVNYIQAGNSSGVPAATTSDAFHAGALYWDTGTHSMQVFNDSSAWVSLGGGSGSPGGANTNVQFNSSGSFAGSTNFIWTGTVLGVSGTVQANGASGAFNAPLATAYNAIQAPMGGMAALSFTAVNYIQAGNHSGVPTATTSDAFHAGALYYDTGSHTLQLFNDSAAWVALATGGATSPGGATTNVQFNSAGSFAGSANFVWTGTVLGVTGTVQANGASGGFNANGGTAYNAVQAASGGMAALSFTAVKYMQTGNSAGPFGSSPPPLTTSDAFHAGAISWDTATGCESVYNGTTWGCIGAGTGTPGGANTNVQYNNSGTLGGSANFTWNNGTQLLSVTGVASTAGIALAGGAFFQATGTTAGFTAPTATAFNAFQVPSGGMLARSFTATTYIQSGSSSSNPTPTTSDTINAGAMYYNTVSACEEVYSGSAWACIGLPGTNPGGSNTAVQFNNSGSFGGSSNFVWANAAQQLTVTTTSGVAGVIVAGGYVQSAQGFNSPSYTNYNTVQAPNGGMAARSLTATTYAQAGNSAGVPTVTSGDTFRAGALYWDTTGTPALKVFNGSSWLSLGTTGVQTLNSLSGALNIVGTANEITVTPSGTNITLATPQAIGTGNTPTFAGVIANGTFNSAVAGATIGLQVNGGNFQVNGNGALSMAGALTTTTGVNVQNTAVNSIQTSGSINSCNAGGCAGGASYQVHGVTVIDNNGNWVGGTVSAAIISVSGILSAAGHVGITSSTCSHWTLGICDAP